MCAVDIVAFRLFGSPLKAAMFGPKFVRGVLFQMFVPNRALRKSFSVHIYVYLYAVRFFIIHHCV